MDLLIRNIRPMGGAPADILVQGGRIARIAPGIEADAPVEDGGGHLAVPGLIDAHTHLDKTTWGMDWHVNAHQATLQQRIDFEREQRLEIGIDPHRQSMRHALGLVAHGATHIRSHVDIDTRHGLAMFHGVMETRQALAGIIDIEIVAFPQSAIMARPGTVDLMDRALAEGAGVVGGIDPCGMERDPKGALDTIFGLAERHGKPIDIHLHEMGELGAFSMEMIFDRIRALSMQGKVAISHAFCLGAPDWQRTQGLIDQLAELDVAILTTGAPSVPVPAILRLRDAGIRVGAGCDGIRDTWGPWGKPDMLHRAEIIGMKNGFRRDVDLNHALHVCSVGGADVMGIPHGLAEGMPADFTLLQGQTLAHAVADTAPRPLVVKGGRVTARMGEVMGVAAP
ncbi:MAG: amidohydrolase family protein [Paracoccus sp. (in: a-proteobacteria)]|uniref:amidohydrolase family protein n=1 Tax=Paracoccus sp. TaxID=267 RepID=UPI0026DF7086|nr:amidohydrolase family protein [Paracoccus sp. (in: a-proteobacteria)]MDO5611949.1 amidohydrolase family protein [Paracoccus sp. (in: a-proteobacteria)]